MVCGGSIVAFAAGTNHASLSGPGTILTGADHHHSYVRRAPAAGVRVGSHLFSDGEWLVRGRGDGVYLPPWQEARVHLERVSYQVQSSCAIQNQFLRCCYPSEL